MQRKSRLIQQTDELKTQQSLLDRRLPTVEVSFAAESEESNLCRQLVGRQAGTEL